MVKNNLIIFNAYILSPHRSFSAILSQKFGKFKLMAELFQIWIAENVELYGMMWYTIDIIAKRKFMLEE